MSTSLQIEQLAAAIGEEVYLEVAKWRLYLNDAHLHTQLAELLFPLIEAGDLKPQSIERAMQSLLVNIGGGKSSLPLIEFIPNSVFSQLIKVLHEYHDGFSS